MLHIGKYYVGMQVTLLKKETPDYFYTDKSMTRFKTTLGTYGSLNMINCTAI